MKPDCLDVVTWVSVFVLVGIIVVYSGRPAGTHITWAYHIGDQPLFRLLYLLGVMFVADRSLPIAILAVTLYLLINSMVPVLSQIDENFIWNTKDAGKPVANCGNYSEKSVEKIGTPFYPLTLNEPADINNSSPLAAV